MNEKKQTIDWFEVALFVGKIGMVILVMIGVIAFTMTFPRSTEKLKVVESWTVWECDAPHGRYWTDESASGGLTFFKSSSDLKESYTVKYLQGDILRTIIFDSTNSNFLVHLTTTSNMTLEICKTTYKNGFGHESLDGPTIYQLYIPDPKILGAT